MHVYLLHITDAPTIYYKQIHILCVYILYMGLGPLCSISSFCMQYYHIYKLHTLYVIWVCIHTHAHIYLFILLYDTYNKSTYYIQSI